MRHCAWAALLLAGSVAAEPFDERCMAALTTADRELVRSTRARLARKTPGEVPAALFHNSADWGCARIRFRIDAQGLAVELKVEQAWPDWTYARAAYRLVQQLRFTPARTPDATDAALIAVNLAGADEAD